MPHAGEDGGAYEDGEGEQSDDAQDMPFREPFRGIIADGALRAHGDHGKRAGTPARTRAPAVPHGADVVAEASVCDPGGLAIGKRRRSAACPDGAGAPTI